MGRFFIFALLLLPGCFLAGAAWAQTPAPKIGPPVLTSVAAVLKTRTVEVQSAQLPVRLKGTIVSVGLISPRFFLHDGGETIMVVPYSPVANIRHGLTAEVEGLVSVYTSRTGRPQLMISGTSVKLGEEAALPPAKLAGLASLSSFEQLDQWTSLEAYVMAWQLRDNLLTLKVVTREGMATVLGSYFQAAQIPPKLLGAKVRLTGVNAPESRDGNVMYISFPKSLEVLEPGGEEVFDAPLVSIAEVNARKVELGKRLRVRGTYAATLQGDRFVITGQDQALVALTEAPRGPDVPGYVYGQPGTRPEPRPGDEVEIVGSVIDAKAGGLFIFGLSGAYARIVGKGEVPKAKPVLINEVINYRNADHWVTLEGVVGAWSLQRNAMYYLINDASGSMTVSVRNVPEVFPKNLWGARIRITGVVYSHYLTYQGTEFGAQDNSFVEVLSPGRNDQFEGPERPVSEIATGRVPAAELVKARGVLVGQNDRVLYIRGKDGSLCVNLKAAWSRPSFPSQFAEGVPAPALKIGDEVEVAGHRIPVKTDMRYAPFDLVNAQVRVLGHGDKPEPVVTSFERVASGEHTADLVQVRGRLLTWQTAPVERGLWRNTLLLKADGTKLTVVHQSANANPFDTLKADDDVLLQGVVDRETSQTPRQICVFAPSDAKSLGVSPEVTVKRLWMWGGGLTTLLVLFSGWIFALRRSIRVKSEVASLLEQKVNERTQELSRAQAELSKALEQERELGDLKSRFVSMVSHEFRTPLGVTMSAVEIMRHFDDKLPPEKRRELCDEIHAATRNMAGLMEQVLVLGRVEAGKLGFRPAPVDMEVLVGKLVDESLSATNRRCPIELHCDAHLHDAVGDEALVRHILSNLVANAVKYSPEGMPVQVRTRRDGSHLVFEIEDHGIGIPENERAHLYEAFHRCTNVGDIPGTGLGLVIVKRCVDLHNGSIDLHSEPGKGTTFVVRLPMFDSPR